MRIITLHCRQQSRRDRMVTKRNSSKPPNEEVLPPAPCASPEKPPIVNEIADCIIPVSLWSNWTPSSGKREIRRPMTAEERACVSGRAAELRHKLQPYSDQDRDAVD